MDVEEKTTTDLVAVSRDIMCLSCSAPIVMGFDAMVGLRIIHKEDPLYLRHVGLRRYSIHIGMTICNL